jgi:hypothetical protein
MKVARRIDAWHSGFRCWPDEEADVLPRPHHNSSISSGSNEFHSVRRVMTQVFWCGCFASIYLPNDPPSSNSARRCLLTAPRRYVQLVARCHLARWRRCLGTVRFCDQSHALRTPASHPPWREVTCYRRIRDDSTASIRGLKNNGLVRMAGSRDRAQNPCRSGACGVSSLET